MYGGGAAAAATANAIKASGAIVDVEPEDFLKILAKMEEPLVVTAEGGLFKTNYKHITSYKGLFFHTKAKDPIKLPIDSELIKANSISIPD